MVPAEAEGVGGMSVHGAAGGSAVCSPDHL